MSPELKGVEIAISQKGAAQPVVTVLTDDNGAYRYVTAQTGSVRRLQQHMAQK